MTRIPDEFISCDWGLSNFRLSRVRSGTLEVLDHRATPMGVSRMQRALEGKQDDRYGAFVDYLLSQVSEVMGPRSSGECVVVASGMVSSSMGLRELPYAAMPLGADGKGLVTERINAGDGLTVLLVSGMRDGDNLMRGEETQAVGLADDIPLADKGILVLPGTHSKHVVFEQGKFIRFTTCFTGELFELLSSQSILRHSIAATPWSESHRDTFLDGVHRAARDGLSASLFSVRARDLLGKSSKEENDQFLSGLIIGSEAASLARCELPVYLAASESLRAAYRIALQSELPADQFHCLPLGALEHSLLKGHSKILAL